MDAFGINGFLCLYPSTITPLILQGADTCNATATPQAQAEGESSGDEFSEDDGDEQETIMKTVKFPEIETPAKIPSAAPKVNKCLEKRIKGLQDVVAKFSPDDALTELQKTFLSSSN